MKKKFKMVVVSLSFLIISGILVACGHKKKNVKESTTEIDIVEVNEEYNYVIPDNFDFVNDEDAVKTYRYGNDVLCIYTEDLDDTIDKYVFDKEQVHEIIKDTWIVNGKEINYTYENKETYVITRCIARYNAEKEVLGMHYNVFDLNNKKLIFISYLLADNDKEDEKIKQEMDSITNSFEEFIRINF